MDGIGLHPVALSSSDIECFYGGSRTRRSGRSTTTRSSRRSIDRAVARCLPHRSTRGSRRRPTSVAAGARPSGCTTTNSSSSRRCCGPAAGPADRLLPPHPVPADRAVHADAAAGGDPPRAARRRPRRVPAEAGSAELRPACPPPARPAIPGHDASRSTGAASRAGAFPISIDAREMEQPRRHRRGSGRGRARSAPSWATRRRSSSASTGSTTRRASSSGSRPSASCSRTGR